jgi:shikimate dehydrogenase
MHNAAYRALGIDWAYLPLPVPPDRLGAAVRGLAALGFAGANVTVPHKQAVLAYLDRLSPAARAIGAANTLIVHADGSVSGDNTDGAGFLADLMRHGFDPLGRRALVLGAGGAARAVVWALAEAGASVAIANRTFARAEALAGAVQAALPSCIVTAHSYPLSVRDLATDADLIVNATTIGMRDGAAAPGLRLSSEESPWDPSIPLTAGQCVYDLVYAPWHPGSAMAPALTPFLAQAQQAGAKAIDGLGMLAHQGALAFEAWTGLRAPLEVMIAVLGRPAARDVEGL